MPNVVDIRTKRRAKKGQKVSLDVYLQTLDLVAEYIRSLRLKRNPAPTKGAIAATDNMIEEIRFCAKLNYRFRQDSYKTLLEILDDLYIELNEKELNEDNGRAKR
jgi:hypothetical protein